MIWEVLPTTVPCGRVTHPKPYTLNPNPGGNPQNNPWAYLNPKWPTFFKTYMQQSQQGALQGLAMGPEFCTTTTGRIGLAV